MASFTERVSVAPDSHPAIIAGQHGGGAGQVTRMASEHSEEYTGGRTDRRTDEIRPSEPAREAIRESLPLEQTSVCVIRPYTCNLDHFRQSGNNSLERVFGATFR